MIKRVDNNMLTAIVVSVILAVFLGGRSTSSPYFGDTAAYAWTFNQYKAGGKYFTGEETEWVWVKIMSVCSQIMDDTSFLILIDLAYFGLTLWACKRLCPNNVLVAMLFMMGAFSFFTYGTNGIRNGLACSGVLVFLSFLRGSRKEQIISALIALMVVNIHTATLLPVTMAVISILFIKDYKYACVFWLLSIIISLVAGNFISSIFGSLGFDKRTSYFTSMEADLFNRVGFRWDFLIYSMMPIILGYYVIIKRGIRNRTYEFLLNTYTLSNAFWIMVIRANYSNRFAYLSWFMYPLVLAYPLLRMDIWGGQQGKNASRIMLAHIGFTWFMVTIYW